MKQQPHKFPEWKVTLEERVEPNVPSLPSKSTLTSESISDISLRVECAGDPTPSISVVVAQQSAASQALHLKLDVLEHQAGAGANPTPPLTSLEPSKLYVRNVRWSTGHHGNDESVCTSLSVSHTCRFIDRNLKIYMKL